MTENFKDGAASSLAADDGDAWMRPSADSIQPSAPALPAPSRLVVLGGRCVMALRGEAAPLCDAARSQAIDFARFALIVGLVFLHYGQFPNSSASPYRGMALGAHPLATYVNSLVTFFLFSAVPLLSAISGYLFFSFRDRAGRELRSRIKRRCVSLYLPLVLWNGLYLAILLLIWTSTPQHPLINNLNIELGDASALRYLDAITGLTRHPVAFQFWFVRDLFLAVLCSPLLWLLMRKAPWAGALALGLVWLSGATLGIFFRTDVLFFFYLGGVLRVMGTPLQIGTRATILLAFVYVALAAVRAAVPAFHDDAPNGLAHDVLMVTTRCMRLVGVLACWGLVLRLAPTRFGRAVASLSGFAFFLFALHYPLIAEIKLLLWPLMPAATDAWMLVHYVASVLLTVTIAVGTGLLLARAAPPVFALLNGGRAPRRSLGPG